MITQTKTLGIRADATELDYRSLVERISRTVRPALYTFVNPASVITARSNHTYRGMLDKFNAVLPDGIGMCWAIRKLHRLPAVRVSFDTTSLAPEVFRWALRERLRVVLIGGRQGTAERAAENLRDAFPGLMIAATLDGYGDIHQKVREVKSAAPAIVICGMGAGAQERFLIELTRAGWSGIGFTCGGYLDQLAEGLNYYPDWINASNLRWAYRLFREPRRLARRYCVDYVMFVVFLGRALLSRSG